jgi:hypothetical protein
LEKNLKKFMPKCIVENNGEIYKTTTLTDIERLPNNSKIYIPQIYGNLSKQTICWSTYMPQ